MYNKIKAEEPTFLIVESMEGEVFGGFATSAWASGCQVKIPGGGVLSGGFGRAGNNQAYFL